MQPIRRSIVLTGASGKVGRKVAPFLGEAFELRCTDIQKLSEADRKDQFELCDLTDFESTRKCFEGADVVVHLAAIPRDVAIDEIAQANLVATYNVYEACRVNGIKRVVFGSTNHVVGFYPVEQHLTTKTQTKPDCLYGATKVFGEALASLYWEKHGIESVCVRIGSVMEKPVQPRHLSTWVSHRDLAELISCSITAPRVGLTTVYGVSSTSRGWWDNAGARHLGYVPKDNADDHAKDVLSAAQTADIHAPEEAFQGGKWAAEGYDR